MLQREKVDSLDYQDVKSAKEQSKNILNWNSFFFLYPLKDLYVMLSKT